MPQPEGACESRSDVSSPSFNDGESDNASSDSCFPSDRLVVRLTLCFLVFLVVSSCEDVACAAWYARAGGLVPDFCRFDGEGALVGCCFRFCCFRTC